MSVCPGISYRHQLQFQETSLSVPYLRDIFNIHSRWFLFLDVHSFLISINLRMISPCLGFSFLYWIRFFFFECCFFLCQQPTFQSCFDWSPFQRRCLAMRNVLGIGRSWNCKSSVAPCRKLPAVVVCYCVTVMSTATTSHNSVSKIEDLPKHPENDTLFVGNHFRQSFGGRWILR